MPAGDKATLHYFDAFSADADSTAEMAVYRSIEPVDFTLAI